MKKPGPKPLPERATRKTVKLADVAWERIDAYRHANRIKSETVAVQRVVDAGLRALGVDAADPATGADRAKEGEGDA